MAKLKEFVRNPYNYDVDQVSDETGLKCTDKSLTQQEFAEESDINFIAERYGLTGEMPQIEGLTWGAQFDQVFDFQSAQNAVVAAREQFMTLPAKLRSRFDNDPGKLLAFLDDEDNYELAVTLGLVTPKPVESPKAEPAGDTKGANPTPGNKPAGDAPKTPKTDT